MLWTLQHSSASREPLVPLSERDIHIRTQADRAGQLIMNTFVHCRQYFVNFGDVEEAWTSVDRHTGRPRGFGFVVFSSAAVADKVCSIQHTIDRREVRSGMLLPSWQLLKLAESPTQHPCTAAGRKGDSWAPPCYV